MASCGTTITAAERAANPIYALAGATEVCRFGEPDAYAVALLGGPVDGDCSPFDPARLALRRPGAGEEEWRLVEQFAGVTHSLMGIPGTWQQSYTRGAYLIDFLRRQGMDRICIDRRPDPSLIYFR